MSNDVAIVDDRIGGALGSLVTQARSRVTLVAPFIKRPTLETLLAGLAPAAALTICTRWNVREIAVGVSDLGVHDFARGRAGSRLLLHPRLHAKVLLIDDKVVAIGSANVTDAALGFAEPPNAEVMAVLPTVPTRLFLFLSRLERESVVATDDLRRRFEEALKDAPPPWTPPDVDLTGEAPRGPPVPLPLFRNPERLYPGYVSITEFHDPETRAAILEDLGTLALPDGLDEPTFRNRVGADLLAMDPIAAFDQFVAQPHYFGEMAEWLRARGVLAGHGQEDRKRYLQSLVRWLLHFLPGRYRLEEPGYSELFGRVEGWGAPGGASR